MPGLPVAVRLGADPVVFAVKTVGAEGKPVAGAAVHVVSVAPNNDTAIMSFLFADAGPLDGVTDAEGVLHFSGLPAEARLSLNIAAEGLASVAVQLAEDTGTERTVTMVPEGASAAGCCTTASRSLMWRSGPAVAHATGGAGPGGAEPGGDGQRH